METTPQPILDLVSGLLAEHWTEIAKQRNETEDGAFTVSLSVKLSRDGRNRDRAKVSIGYGVRVKDEAEGEIDDPRQQKMGVIYELKKEKH
jgi:hypothetical protein